MSRAPPTTGPLTEPRLSRVHIVVRATRSGDLEVVNRGRSGMTVGGTTKDHAALRPGGTVQLGSALLLVCEMRPLTFPEPIIPLASHPFGYSDASGMVGEGPCMWALREEVAGVALQRAHVLVQGPSGSGKELVSRAIHRLSGALGPLVSRNAATFPGGLIDAELFGNVRNYPNPGMPSRPGLIGQVEAGTLFLDEIGELPAALQAHLLRVLDAGEYHRLGESKARRCRFRFVGATLRSEGALRHDFLARMPSRVQGPGLNALRSDLPLLMAHLVRRMAEQEAGIGSRFLDDAGNPRISPSLVRHALGVRYTTNVRQLEGLLRLSALHSAGRYLTTVPQLHRPTGAVTVIEEPVDPCEVNEEAIRRSLARHAGVREKVWRDLGLSSRFVLARLMKKHGIQ